MSEATYYCVECMNRFRSATCAVSVVLVLVVVLAPRAWQGSTGRAHSTASQWRSGDEAAPGWAASRVDLCTAKNAVGVGLRGEYFSDPAWRGQPVLTRLDPVIDFATDFELPPELALGRMGSVRWLGWVKAPLTGSYRFHVDLPGARVLVSQRVVLADGASRLVEMTAGRHYPLQIDIQGMDPGAAQRVRLEWTAPHGARYLIPRALLNQPMEAASANRS
jgi:PA14 domain